MDINRLAQRQANSLPGFQLVSYYSCGIPFYKLLLNVTIQKEKSIGLIEEFCLKLIQAGVTDSQEISNFLGISLNLVEEAFLELTSNDLIKVITTPKMKVLLTPQGLKCLDTANIIVPEMTTLHIYLDGLTGEMYPIFRALKNRSTVRKLQLHTVKEDVEAPTLDNISFKDVSKQYKRQIDRGDISQVTRINEIEKCYTEYREVSVLVFQSEETLKWDIQVFDGAERLSEYESILIRMENEGIKQIKSDAGNSLPQDEIKDKIVEIPDKIWDNAKKNTKEVQKQTSKEIMLKTQIKNEQYILDNIEDLSIEDKFSKTCKIAELEEQLKNLKVEQTRDRILNTYDHRPLLEDALETAQKYVVIVSPWIKSSGFDSVLEEKVKSALKRNIRVIIAYGISKKTEHDQQSLKRLRDIKKGPLGQNLYLVDLSNTHEKVLLVDSKYAVITSFNWLSFKGDPNRSFRQETGIYTESTNLINQSIRELEKRLGIKIVPHLNKK